MNSPASHPLHRLRRFFAWGVAVLLVTGLPAQPAAGGVISGRIFNPATGEYLRNAEIRIAETGQSAASGNEGTYRVSPVPPGKATLVVSYTGYRTATAVVDVAAGATANRDFDLLSSLQTEVAAETIKLGAFVVSTEREGNAKAIMEQRRSMATSANSSSTCRAWRSK